LQTGVLLVGALGHLSNGGTEVVFSLWLLVPAHNMAQGVLRGNSGVLNLDRVAKNNPGRAGYAATLCIWEVLYVRSGRGHRVYGDIDE
jgi:hypothetical protein